jgi:hypothetical protein
MTKRGEYVQRVKRLLVKQMTLEEADSDAEMPQEGESAVDNRWHSVSEIAEA